MPSWILWLSPVVVAPLLAVVWMSWAARPRGPVEAIETVEEHNRFKAALTTPLPPGPVPRPRTKPSRPVRPKEPI
jgi:hypothetical protein